MANLPTISGVPLRETPASIWVRIYCFVNAADSLPLLLVNTTLHANLHPVTLKGPLSAVAGRLRHDFREDFHSKEWTPGPGRFGC